LVIVLPGGRVHEFVIGFRRHIKKLVDMAALEFQLESPMHIRIFMISNLSYASGRDEGPVHWSRASFHQRDVSHGRIRFLEPAYRYQCPKLCVRAIARTLAATNWGADVTPCFDSIDGDASTICV